MPKNKIYSQEAFCMQIINIIVIKIYYKMIDK